MIQQKKDLLKQRINYISVFLILLSFLTVVSIPSAAAADREDAEGPAILVYGMLDQINEGVFKQVEDTFFGGHFDTIITGPTVTVVSAAVTGVGAAMCCLYAYLRFIKEVQRGQDVIETLLKVISQTAISVLLCIYVMEILSYLDDLGEYIFKSINDALAYESTVENGNEAYASTVNLTVELLFGEDFDVNNWINGMLAIIILLLPWVISLAMSVVAKICAMSILVEIALRKALAPFAVAQVSGEGLRSNGFRFFKRYLAQYIKQALCLLICAFGKELLIICVNIKQTADQTGDFGLFFTFIIGLFASQFTCIGLMFKTGELANDIVGQ